MPNSHCDECADPTLNDIRRRVPAPDLSCNCIALSDTLIHGDTVRFIEPAQEFGRS